MQHSIDRHHILPSSKWGTNYFENIVKLDIRKHKALHMLFDANTVSGQIERILDIASTALTEEVKSDIIKILDRKELDYWYKDRVFKR